MEQISVCLFVYIHVLCVFSGVYTVFIRFICLFYLFVLLFFFFPIDMEVFAKKYKGAKVEEQKKEKKETKT
jgi:hypothetical protein